MTIKKVVILLLILNLLTIYYSQKVSLSENEVNRRFDQAEAEDLKINELKKFDSLYEYSISKDYQSGILRGLLAKQRHYLTLGEYTKSREYGEKAEVIAKKLNDYKSLSIINTYWGNVFTILGLRKEAKYALTNAMKQSERINNIIDRNIRQSYICASYAGLYEGKKNDSVLFYTQKGLNIIESTPKQHLNVLQKSKYYYMLIFQNMNMGNFYTYSAVPKDLDKAEEYFLKTLSYSHSVPYYFNTIAADAYDSVSLFYFFKKDYKSSIKYSQKVLKVERKNSNPRMRLNAYENLKNSYEAINSIPMQIKYLKLYSDLNDSISASNNQFIISHSENELDLSKSKVYSLKKELIAIVIVGAIIVLTIRLYFYRRNKELKKNYLKLIKRLKVEELHYDNPKIENVDFISNSNGISLSSEKEQIIIKKLASFESSEKFLKKNITLSYLAHQLNTNHKYLSQIINKYKDQNFNSYINHLRIKYIVDKLYNDPLYKEYKISYLAEECGYSSPQVFINAFKKETGMTPSYFISNLKKQ
ncbi:AraC family transcriptional regulator [Elizabethkingia anophelis]|uniref:helix-turn-helix domain-containing protein n=1 Tax=Elizabethkingia anophelis TaxID=1117645 RepID=UPI001F4A9231|nr:helix-turn-helix domain-containing protein [Elizabethkingia anophelis]MDV3567990.1 AraC family transcriptional regulator [Elizabethkingia anophelis]MDV3969624.1 AraC family transcriptional regulator [Elizabethkingia anophelis]